MTTLLVLVILGLIWAAVLVPPYLQNRREHRPGDSIASFRHQLTVLERATPEGRARSRSRQVAMDRVQRMPGAPVAHAHVAPHTAAGYEAAAVPRPRPTAQPAVQPRHMSYARKRRRDIFLTLLAAVPVTLLLAVGMGGFVWALQAVVDVAFLAYVGLLIKLQQESAERDLKVRFLQPTALRSVEQPAMLRRVGS